MSVSIWIKGVYTNVFVYVNVWIKVCTCMPEEFAQRCLIEEDVYVHMCKCMAEGVYTSV